MKKFIKILACASFTFVLASCSSQESNIDFNILESNKSYNVSNIDRRNFLSRNVKRREPAGEVGQYEKTDYPYFEANHKYTMNYNDLYDENYKIINDEKENLLKNHQLNKYVGSYKLYNGEEISSKTKATDMVFTYAPNSSAGLNATGLYAAPGEIVDVYFPYEYKDKLFNLQYDSETGNLNYVPRNVAIVIGVQSSRNDMNYNYGKGAVNGNTIPVRVTKFSANDLLNFEDTVVLDGKRYFHSVIGSPVGGPIYFQSNCGISFDVRFIGALESFYFAYNVTSNKEWADEVKNVTAPYVDVVGEGYRISGPAFGSVKKLTKMEEIATFWNNVTNLSGYFSGGRQAVSQIYDYRVDAGAAVAFVNKWFSMLPAGWITGALNYDSMMNGGAWGDIHELNHHYEYYNDIGPDGRGWNYFIQGDVSNNVLNGMSYALYTNIAQNRNDSVNGGFAGGQATADPYTNLYQFYKNKFKDTAIGHVQNVYLGIFHSLGLQFLKDTRRDWVMGDAETKYLYTMLARKTGYDFKSFLSNTLHWTSDKKTGGLDSSADSYLKADVCKSSVDPSYSKPCEYTPFAATASVYTMANQTVSSIEDFKANIKDNLKINKSWPIALTDEEILQEQKVSTGYMNKYTGNRSTSFQNATELYQDQIDRAVYKVNQTGRPFKVSPTIKTILNFDPTLDSVTHDPAGRLLSTEKIESVELVYQKDNAISKVSDFVYEFDPDKTKEDLYPFAIGVKYKDPSFKDLILYGKLVKNGSEILADVYDTSIDAAKNTDIDTLLKEADYSYDSIKKKYGKSIINIRQNSAIIPSYTPDQGVTQALSVETFDFISNSDGNYQFKIAGDKNIALVYNKDKKNNLGIVETEKVYGNFADTNTEQKVLNLQLKQNERVSFYFYHLSSSGKARQTAVAFRQYSDPNNKDTKSIQNILRANDNEGETSSSSNYVPPFTTISGSYISSIGKSIFDNSKEVYKQIFKNPSSEPNTKYVYSSNTSNSNYLSGINDIRLVGIGKFKDVKSMPEDPKDYDKNTTSENFVWDTLNDKTGSEYNKTLTKFNYFTDNQFAWWYNNNYFAENHFERDVKTEYFVLKNENRIPFNFLRLTSYTSWNHAATVGDFDVYVGDEALKGEIGFDISKYKYIGTDKVSDYFIEGDYSADGQGNTDKYCYYAGPRNLKLDKTYNNKYIVVKVTSMCHSKTLPNTDRIAINEIQIGRNYNIEQNKENLKDTNIYSFEDVNPKLNGDMSFVNDTMTLNGKGLHSNSKGSVSFTFSGRNLAIYGRLSPLGGNATITIDGKKLNFSTYAKETKDMQLLISYECNNNKLHKVKIDNVGGNSMYLQALNAIPGSDYSLAGPISIAVILSLIAGAGLTVGIYFLVIYLKKQSKNKPKKETSNEEKDTKNETKKEKQESVKDNKVKEEKANTSKSSTTEKKDSTKKTTTKNKN